MRVFTSDKIRNVVLLGHGGSGKTSLAESMAFLSGLKEKAGSVEAGNTISDYDEVEKRHKISVHLSLLPLIWEDTKINLLDTPGYPDFVGEVEEAVSVADAAVIVVSGGWFLLAGLLRSIRGAEPATAGAGPAGHWHAGRPRPPGPRRR